MTSFDCGAGCDPEDPRGLAAELCSAVREGYQTVTLTPAQRSLRARIAANTRWSREDPAPTGPRGQAGLMARFAREVDPDGTLPPAERARRVDSARKAHMQRLALASAKARGRKVAAREATPAA
ncbi:MAG: hypothetical protein ACRDS0_40145 [Pseudonocardiaceae bacterium]